MNRKTVFRLIMGIILILLAGYGVLNLYYYKIRKGQAPYLSTELAFREMEAVSEGLEDEKYGTLMEKIDREKEYISFEDFQTILELYPVEQPDFMDDYKKGGWNFSLEDWNRYLRALMTQSGSERVQIEKVLIVGDGRTVSPVDETDGRYLHEDELFTNRGILTDTEGKLQKECFRVAEILRLDEKIVSCIQKTEEEGSLQNCYILTVSEGQTEVMKGKYRIRISGFLETELPADAEREIADLFASGGKIRECRVKQEMVSGKLIRISPEEAEIEGQGIFPLQEEAEFYRNFSEPCSLNRRELPLGYAFTDFILEDGKIAAGLLQKDEYMDHIRVLIRNSDYESKRHEELQFSCSGSMKMLTYLDGREVQETVVEAGEKVVFTKESFMEDNGQEAGKRIKLVPEDGTDEITILSVRRSQGNPSYGGTLEITCSEDGFMVVNEVSLEEYLTRVVPSEMPAGYPAEALKAQAVCARTYAYGKLKWTGLPAYGAQADDSAAYQVYNNIKPKETATQAVRETARQILTCEGNPIGAYYYSTSAGCGSGTEIWHGAEDTPPYLIPREIGKGASEKLPEQLKEEENFSKFIKRADSSHFESEEGWYRWQVEKNSLDTEALVEVLRKRQEAYPNQILVKNEKGDFETGTVPELGKIQKMEITKRLAGGIADELIISGTEATVKVVSELNICHVLAGGNCEVERQTGDTLNYPVLPSAFISLQLYEKDEIITGYRIYGGGFGHGVGMSQNAAKNMANDGMTCKDILNFFYRGSELSGYCGQD